MQLFYRKIDKSKRKVSFICILYGNLSLKFIQIYSTLLLDYI